MVLWLIIISALSGFAGVAGGATLPVQPLGQGVTVAPAGGWESAQNVWKVGQGAISLQRSGALVAFAAYAYTGNTQQLLDDQLSSIQQQFGRFSSLPVAQTTLANGQPALKVLFSGTSNSSDLDGELVAVATGQTGVVMMAVASTGQLSRVQGDLDQMLDSLVIPK